MPRDKIQRTIFSRWNVNAEIVVVARSCDVSHRRPDFSRNSKVKRSARDAGELSGRNRLRVSLGYLIGVDANDMFVNFCISTLL